MKSTIYVPRHFELAVQQGDIFYNTNLQRAIGVKIFCHYKYVSFLEYNDKIKW